MFISRSETLSSETINLVIFWCFFNLLHELHRKLHQLQLLRPFWSVRLHDERWSQMQKSNLKEISLLFLQGTRSWTNWFPAASLRRRRWRRRSLSLCVNLELRSKVKNLLFQGDSAESEMHLCQIVGSDFTCFADQRQREATQHLQHLFSFTEKQ